MNYEQKYKNALERARDLMTNQNPPAFDKHLIEIVFPELAESEDEKIRKELIENFKWFCGDYPETTKWGKGNGLLVKDIIAWLEKQGEKKHFSNFKAKDLYVFKAKDWYVSKVDGKIHNMTYNPTDKVEPKFKVGDKVTMKGDNTVYTIDIIAPDKTCWLTHGSRAYGWATFGVLKHYVE